MNIDFNRRLSIAPMLDCTDRHERYFLRLISKHVLLYSEMVVTHALLHAKPEMFLGHEEFEYPAVLQLGGSNPADLAKCSKMVEAAGFQEVNLNCGCPSDRVQSGSFGACLMKDKNLVADCFKSMQDAVSIPVSIKCRIGVDEFDSWDFFRDFVGTIADAGCKYFIIHARKAWLKGLSPKENREVPPLHYEFVHKLKTEMPQLNIAINGGIRSMDQVLAHLNGDPTSAGTGVALDGVMVGREPYENPWFLHDADERVFGDTAPATKSRKAVLEAYLPYVEKQFAEGCPATILVKHIYGLFAGLPGARKFRQMLSEGAPRAKNYGGPAELIRKAMEFVVEEV
ncbi:MULTISPECIES: tRNA dihydrouridine(20/20a) synthase DusA [unclassified Fibrobacter]|uniref:tRNA dihydrouridine(20/20a) synthase DusA n=1 Tax=unclassified Fibrobacter TaxID=2634177 RepID=UPI00091F6E07|nr:MULTISPECIES: tRNA dihydrouridine(20/20a) synthase DusA [unclassified Fibrobacter]OWV04971.1 tRNA dihydrouridine(20/20a) synthase DusA [Fibrobacter sp. UWH3]SHK35309.1 tRNA-dihydrouridine synthase A [Fibrobacter sp. UWH6]